MDFEDDVINNIENLPDSVLEAAEEGAGIVESMEDQVFGSLESFTDWVTGADLEGDYDDYEA